MYVSVLAPEDYLISSNSDIHIVSTQLEDRYGRHILRLRIKVTNKCNYRCFFCHGEGSSETSDLLSPDDIEFIVKTLMKVGVRKFKITGGEPLLRADIVEIIRRIGSHEPEDISLTTNGYFLKDLAKDLRRAGLRRIDVSVHTLCRDKYILLTGVDGLHRVLEGLAAARDVGFDKVKVNMLVTSLNVDDIPDMMRFCKRNGFTLQLIEYMPIGRGCTHFRRFYIPLRAVYETLKRRASKVLSREDLHRRPILVVDGVEIELIMGFANPEMCRYCTQLRLTSDGRIRGCLYRKDLEISVLDCVKNRDSEELIRRVKYVISRRRPMFTRDLTQEFQASFLTLSQL